MLLEESGQGRFVEVSTQLGEVVLDHSSCPLLRFQFVSPGRKAMKSWARGMFLDIKKLHLESSEGLNLEQLDRMVIQEAATTNIW